MKNKKKKQFRHDNPDAKHRFCDPGACDHCTYLGEGDFSCDTHQVIVVEDWTPTEDYMKCKTVGGKKGKPRGR